MLRLKKTHIYCLEKLERALLMLKVAFEKHLKHWLWMSQERNIVTKPPAFQPSLPPPTRAAGSWEIDLGVTLESWELSHSCLTPLVCPVRALPSPGLDEGVFRISLFIPCREGKKKKKRGRKKKSHIVRVMPNSVWVGWAEQMLQRDAKAAPLPLCLGFL